MSPIQSIIVPLQCRWACLYVMMKYLYQGWSELDDPDNLGHLGQFFAGSSGSHPQTKLAIWMWPGYHTFFRKKTVLASGKWVNFGSDEGTEILLVWNQLNISWSSCFEAYGVQRFHLQEVCARYQFCILPRMKKSMVLFHFHVILHYF